MAQGRGPDKRARDQDVMTHLPHDLYAPRPVCASNLSAALTGPGADPLQGRRIGYSIPAALCPYRGGVREWPMEFVLLLVVGAAAGFLATRMMNLQTDIPTTIAIGVGGAVIGGLVLRILIELTGWMAGLVGAVLGALVLIWLWKTYLRRR